MAPTSHPEPAGDQRPPGGAARPRTVFFGSPAFAVPSLEAVARLTNLVAVVSQPDRPAGRGQALAAPAVKVAAASVAPDVPVLQPEKIRTGELEAALRALRPDLFVVVAYGRILPQSLLDVPALGPWNVHASLLPRLRGAAPIQWAVINGERETGVSIMRMEAGLDTGPVAAMARTPITDDDTAETMFDKLARVGAELLARTLPSIADGSVTARLQRQDQAAATLAPPLTKDDGRLAFEQPARAVSARARGVEPWPGATTLLGGQVVKLFGVRSIEAEVDVGGVGTSGAGGTGEEAAAPGTILGIDDAGAVVACGQGRVRVREVQLPGKKRVPAAAAAAGRTLRAGMRFGQ